MAEPEHAVVLRGEEGEGGRGEKESVIIMQHKHRMIRRGCCCQEHVPEKRGETTANLPTTLLLQNKPRVCYIMSKGHALNTHPVQHMPVWICLEPPPGAPPPQPPPPPPPPPPHPVPKCRQPTWPASKVVDSFWFSPKQVVVVVAERANEARRGAIGGLARQPAARVQARLSSSPTRNSVRSIWGGKPPRGRAGRIRGRESVGWSMA